MLFSQGKPSAVTLHYNVNGNVMYEQISGRHTAIDYCDHGLRKTDHNLFPKISSHFSMNRGGGVDWRESCSKQSHRFENFHPSVSTYRRSQTLVGAAARVEFLPHCLSNDSRFTWKLECYSK